jgi:hypothetical protein
MKLLTLPLLIIGFLSFFILSSLCLSEKYENKNEFLKGINTNDINEFLKAEFSKNRKKK